MSTYETAKDEFVHIDGIRYAYRRLGGGQQTPLVMIHGFRGTMDHWDPALINPIAARRPVILVDCAGVGKSSGEVSTSFSDWAESYISVIRALGLQTSVDILGYSMGGCVAQLMALNTPSLIRRLILCGTTPSNGQGVVRPALGPFNQVKAAVTAAEHKAAFLDTFFQTSDRCRVAGLASWERIVGARHARSEHVPAEGSHRQAIAFMKFMEPREPTGGSYNHLRKVTIPVLIAGGSDDLLVPSDNSLVLWQKLKHGNARLHLFPDSGHGFLFQYADELATLVNNFLGDRTPTTTRLARM